MRKIDLELRHESDNLSTIYNNGNCIGNFQFENIGRCNTGVNLRWADNKAPYERHLIHFAFSTKESVLANWENEVKKHIFKIQDN